MRKIYLKIRRSILVSIQSVMGVMGLQVRRLGRNVSTDNGEAEVFRLAGANVSTIVEFGAADGRDSERLALRFPNAKVLAIEPVPASFQKLDARRRVAPNIIAVEAAVGAVTGTSELFIASEPDASSISAPVDTGSAFDRHAETVQTTTIKVLTLDELCSTHGILHIDVLKMDAQGAELDAMRGASGLLKSGAIKRIFTEIQFIRLYKSACLFHELWAFLDQHGFYLHGVYELSSNEHGQLCWGDAVFLHESVRPKNATRPFQGTPT